MMRKNLSPEGRCDNSPRCQPWERAREQDVPKGPPRSRAVSTVPSGLPTLLARLPNVETLGYYQPSLRDEDVQILVALDLDLCAPPRPPVYQLDTGLSCRCYELALACVNQALENQSPIGAAKDRFTRALRVGHEPGNVPSLIANTRNVVKR